MHQLIMYLSLSDANLSESSDASVDIPIEIVITCNIEEVHERPIPPEASADKLSTEVKR